MSVEDEEAPMMSVTEATTTFVKSLIGVGILSMPYAFKCSGIACGLGFLIVLWILFVHTHTLVVDCRDKLLDGSNPDLKENDLDLSRVLLEAAGQFHADVCGLMIYLLQFGVLAAYQVFISVNIKDVFHVPQPLVVVGVSLPLMFLSLVRLKSIKWTMIVGLISLGLGYVVVYVHDLGHLKKFGTLNVWTAHDLPTYFGIVLFDMVSTTCVLPILQDMEDKKAFKAQVISVSFAITFFTFASFGLLGYWCFGETAKPMIIRSLPNTIFLQIVKVSMCIGLFCTFPLQLFPATEIADQWHLCGGAGTGTLGQDADEKVPLTPGGSAPAPKIAFYIVRFLTIWLSAAVAIFIPDFGFILALTGALCASTLGITYPCLAYLKLEPDGPMPAWKTGCYYFLALFGFLTGIVCSIMIINGKAEKGH